MRYDEYDSDAEASPSQLEPPAYPFPGERIVFSSARNAPEFTVGEDSWFALSRLDDERVDTFGDHDHRNDYRFTVHTPLRGSTSMFVNHADFESLLLLVLAGLADTDRRGESGSASIGTTFIDHMLADEYDITFE